MAAERQIAHISTADTMYPNWETVMVADLAPAAVPPEANASLRIVERKLERRANHIEDNPTISKITQNKCRADRTRTLRKWVYQERIDCLSNVLEGYFVARGWSMIDAEQMARWWVRDALKNAQQFAAWLGYEYACMEWRIRSCR